MPQSRRNSSRNSVPANTTPNQSVPIHMMDALQQRIHALEEQNRQLRQRNEQLTRTVHEFERERKKHEQTIQRLTNHVKYWLSRNHFTLGRMRFKDYLLHRYSTRICAYQTDGRLKYMYRILENLLEYLKQHEPKESLDLVGECPISLEPFEKIVVTDCHHAFEESFLMRHFDSNRLKVCPCCRNQCRSISALPRQLVDLMQNVSTVVSEVKQFASKQVDSQSVDASLGKRKREDGA